MATCHLPFRGHLPRRWGLTYQEPDKGSTSIIFRDSGNHRRSRSRSSNASGSPLLDQFHCTKPSSGSTPKGPSFQSFTQSDPTIQPHSNVSKSGGSVSIRLAQQNRETQGLYAYTYINQEEQQGSISQERHFFRRRGLQHVNRNMGRYNSRRKGGVDGIQQRNYSSSGRHRQPAIS